MKDYITPHYMLSGNYFKAAFLLRYNVIFAINLCTGNMEIFLKEGITIGNIFERI